jgi:hypothetical protein
MKSALFLLLTIFIFCNANEIKSYENYKYIKINTNELIKNLLQDSEDTICFSNDGTIIENQITELLVSPKVYQKISNFSHEIVIENFQVFLNKEKEDILRVDRELESKLKLAKNDEERNKIKYSEENWFGNYHR